MSDDPVVTSFKADLQARYESASADVRAQIQGYTGVDVQNQQIQNGAASVVSLVQGGYNPASQGDNRALVTSVEGGLMALGPATAGVTVLCAGAVEALWEVGQAVACPVSNAFSDLLGTPRDVACPGGSPCKVTGVWTPEGILKAGGLPFYGPGTFAGLVVPALAFYTAQELNCKGGIPAGMVVDACAQIWNQTHYGPTVAYYIPPLTNWFPIIPTWSSVSNNYTGNVDPNVFFAFLPVSSVPPSGAGSFSSKNSASEGYFDYFQPTGLGSAFPISPPRWVMVNSGPLIPSKKTTAQAVAEGGSVVLLGGLASGILYGWATGKAVDVVFAQAWNGIAGFFKGSAGVVERGIRMPLKAGEQLGRRRRRPRS